MFRHATLKEINLIDSALQEICGLDSTALWPKTLLILIPKRQNHVHTITLEVLNTLERVAERRNLITNLTLEHVGRKIGILSKNLFRIGLEVLHELAPHVKDKFVVDQAGEASFLFGRDIFRKNVLYSPKSLPVRSRIIVFSKHGYPLGLAQVKSRGENEDSTSPFAENLIDYGYYLRSGG